jgi:hypothetical protein
MCAAPHSEDIAFGVKVLHGSQHFSHCGDQTPMKTTLIFAIALIVAGAAVIGYDHYSYTTTDTILQVGPITATAERDHTVSLPPILGWILIGGGVCALAFITLSKKD